MEEVTQKLAEIAKKHGVAFAKEALVELAFPALKEAVKKTATPIDDVVLAALEEPLKKAITEQLEKLG